MNIRVRQAARLRHVLGAVAAVLVLANCSGGDSIYQPTITQQHASSRVKELLQGTADSISPRPTLETYRPSSGVSQCLVEHDDPRSQVTLDYYLRNVRSDNASVGKQILQLWKKDGYQIGDSSGIGTSKPDIHAATKDDFLLALEITGSGDLAITASSPCLWPNGTPPPGH